MQDYGDGTLAIFPGAVEATTSAPQIQASMAAKPRVPLRIGLHVGDGIGAPGKDDYTRAPGNDERTSAEAGHAFVEFIYHTSSLRGAP